MIPDDDELFALAADCGFPGVWVNRLRVAGEAGWRAALGGPSRAVRSERMILLRGLETRLLISTLGGRQRLRDWIQARRSAPTPPMSLAQRRDWLENNLLMYGDESMAPLVLNVLSRVPEFVSAAIVTECAYLLVGLSVRGWFGSASMVSRDDQRPAYQILVAGTGAAAEIERTIAHETAHWFTSEPAAEAFPLKTIVGHANVRALADREQWPEVAHAAQRSVRDERLARGFEDIWSGVR